MGGGSEGLSGHIERPRIFAVLFGRIICRVVLYRVGVHADILALSNLPLACRSCQHVAWFDLCLRHSLPAGRRETVLGIGDHRDGIITPKRADLDHIRLQTAVLEHHLVKGRKIPADPFRYKIRRTHTRTARTGIREETSALPHGSARERTTTAGPGPARSAAPSTRTFYSRRWAPASLSVQAAIDTDHYETGIALSDAELARVRLTPAKFHGEWPCLHRNRL